MLFWMTQHLTVLMSLILVFCVSAHANGSSPSKAPNHNKMVLPITDNQEESSNEINSNKLNSDPFGIFFLAQQIGGTALNKLSEGKGVDKRDLEDRKDTRSRHSGESRREREHDKSITVDKSIRKHEHSYQGSQERDRESSSRSSGRRDRKKHSDRESRKKDGRNDRNSNEEDDDDFRSDDRRKSHDDDRRDRSKSSSDRRDSNRRDRDRKDRRSQDKKNNPRGRGRFIHRIIVKKNVICPDPTHQVQSSVTPAVHQTPGSYYYY